VCTAFDTYLRLEDAQGNQVAFNDDMGGRNRNSRIVFTPSGLMPSHHEAARQAGSFAHSS
jgi:hypothetical protein